MIKLILVIDIFWLLRTLYVSCITKCNWSSFTTFEGDANLAFEGEVNF